MRYWSKQGQLKSLNYSKGDYAKLNGYFNLLQDSWVTIFKNLDIDQCLNTFMNIYNIGVEKYIPVIDHGRKNQVSWQSEGLKKLMNKKKRLWNSLIRKRYQLSNHTQMLLDYKILKREVRGKFKKELRDHEWKVATNFKLHPKMLYKYINEKVKVTSAIRAVKNANNDIITDQKQICEQFNEWLFKGFREETCDVMPEFHKLYPNCDDLKFDPILVSDMLKSLNPNKAPGPDNIHPFILKQCSVSLSIPVYLIFQKSIETGTVPVLWRQANITP